MCAHGVEVDSRIRPVTLRAAQCSSAGVEAQLVVQQYRERFRA